jgi:hypothetical protein
MHVEVTAFCSCETTKEASLPAKSEHNHSRLTFFLSEYRTPEGTRTALPLP